MSTVCTFAFGGAHTDSAQHLENKAGGKGAQGNFRLNNKNPKKTTKPYFKIKILLLIYFYLIFNNINATFINCYMSHQSLIISCLPQYYEIFVYK